MLQGMTTGARVDPDGIDDDTDRTDGWGFFSKNLVKHSQAMVIIARFFQFSGASLSLWCYDALSIRPACPD